MNEVIPIKPKSVEENYRQTSYTLRYSPKLHRVTWTIKRSSSFHHNGKLVSGEVTISDNNADFKRARRAVRKRIDEMIDGK